jgi:signal peptidase II
VPIFAAISVLAAIAIPVWLFVFRTANDWWLTVSLGAVMAGVLGNLYDRLGLSGEVWPPLDPRAGETVYAVRDWILWQINDQWRWPNFNLADSFLVVGATVLFLRAMFEPAPHVDPVEGPVENATARPAATE